MHSYASRETNIVGVETKQNSYQCHCEDVYQDVRPEDPYDSEDSDAEGELTMTSCDEL